MPAERDPAAPAGDGGAAAIAIRPLGAADLDAIGALQEASIRSLGAASYGPAELEAWARFGWQYRRRLLQEEGAFFVAERQGRVVGVGGWSPDSQQAGLAWLRYLFVHPDAARGGIGRRLVGRIEADARGRGSSAFRVWSSLNAVAFYTALGYRRVRAGRWPVSGSIEIDYLLLAKEARAPLARVRGRC